MATPFPAAMFTNFAAGCSGTTLGGMCASGDVCVNSGYPVCVWQAGPQSCPSGYTQSQTTVYVGGMIDDQRGCTGCQCASTPGSCTPTVTLYTDGTCTTDAMTPVSPGFCAAYVATPGIGSAKLNAGTPSGVTCGAPSGGAPTAGQAVGKNPVTVCCTM
jgi:hypothetical protein